VAQAGVSVQVSLKEIYVRLCKKCQKKVRELVKEKLTDQLVEQSILGGGGEGERSGSQS